MNEKCEALSTPPPESLLSKDAARVPLPYTGQRQKTRENTFDKQKLYFEEID